MELEPLTNDLYEPKNYEYNRTSDKNFKICATVFFIIIIGLQLSSLIFLVILGDIARKIDFSSLNMTQQEVYIDKLKRIIDFVCNNYISC